MVGIIAAKLTEQPKQIQTGPNLALANIVPILFEISNKLQFLEVTKTSTVHFIALIDL